MWDTGTPHVCFFQVHNATHCCEAGNQVAEALPQACHITHKCTVV